MLTVLIDSIIYSHLFCLFNYDKVFLVYGCQIQCHAIKGIKTK